VRFIYFQEEMTVLGFSGGVMYIMGPCSTGGRVMNGALRYDLLCRACVRACVCLHAFFCVRALVRLCVRVRAFARLCVQGNLLHNEDEQGKRILAERAAAEEAAR
jgi:hypothetical protein